MSLTTETTSLTGKLSMNQERVNEGAEQFYKDVTQNILESEGILKDLHLTKSANQNLKDLSKHLDEGIRNSKYFTRLNYSSLI